MAKGKKISGFMMALTITILLVILGLVNALVQNPISADSYSPGVPIIPDAINNKDQTLNSDGFQPIPSTDLPDLGF